MDEKIKWKDVTTYEKLVEYIRDEIGEENCYDELFQDLLSGMIYNREQKKKQEELNKKISNMGGILMPRKND
jgi:uncharacterized protein YehS (DUF1456 family)